MNPEKLTEYSDSQLPPKIIIPAGPNQTDTDKLRLFLPASIQNFDAEEHTFRVVALKNEMQHFCLVK